MSQKNLIIKGAREHNLKNVDLTVPRDKFVPARANTLCMSPKRACRPRLSGLCLRGIRNGRQGG